MVRALLFLASLGLLLLAGPLASAQTARPAAPAAESLPSPAEIEALWD